MANVQELKDKVAALDSDVAAVAAKIANQPPAPTIVATQEDLDAIGAGLDKVSADLAPLK